MSVPEVERVIAEADRLFLNDAMFYNRVNLAVHMAADEYKRSGRGVIQRHERYAMARAAAVALVLASDERKS